MKAWTDYPFEQLGDIAYQKAPIREVIIISYDDNLYCKVNVKGVNGVFEVKCKYLYQKEGRCGEVPMITQRQLAKVNSPSNPIICTFKGKK